MKIGIILHPYDETHPAGLERAIYALANAMIAADPKNNYTVFVKGKKKHPPQFQGENWDYVELKEQFLWLDRGLRPWRKKIDIFVFFTPVMPFLFTPQKSLVVAHDFNYKYLPHSLKEKVKLSIVALVHKRALSCASKIIAVSKQTKHDAVTYFNVPEEKIEVVYNGFDYTCDITPHPIQHLVSEPFFLFVGVLKARKNVFNIVRAFQQFKETDTNGYTLLIAGKQGGEYYQKIKDQLAGSKAEKDVVFAGYVTTGELSYLYQNANALVFPSLVEGFGLPVLEAMYCGLPVITSNEGALKEVADEAALLVNPRDSEDIASAMTRIATETDLANTFARKGKERAKDFSWEKAGQEYACIITTISND